MSKNRKRPASPPQSEQKVKVGARARIQWSKIVLAALGVLALAVLGSVYFMPRKSENAAAYVPRPKGELVFTKQVASIVFEHCTVCHRPGQSAPFSLLTYGDVKKHAKDISDVTQRRYMPPWLPEPGYGNFSEERRLSLDEIGILRQWFAEGTPEGSAAELPPSPKWEEDWPLGKPDLVVTMPQPFKLPAEGKDVYRNFVVPMPSSGPRYVRAVDLNPGSRSVVHHAFIKFDRTRESRHLDGKDGQPGFGGMNTSAQMPDGHFLTWQPGKVPSLGNERLAWQLRPDTDLVIQLHLRPTGREESVQASAAFYFTDVVPTNRTFKVSLMSLLIDIPPGQRDYVVQDQ